MQKMLRQLRMFAARFNHRLREFGRVRGRKRNERGDVLVARTAHRYAHRRMRVEQFARLLVYGCDGGKRRGVIGFARIKQQAQFWSAPSPTA